MSDWKLGDVDRVLLPFRIELRVIYRGVAVYVFLASPPDSLACLATVCDLVRVERVLRPAAATGRSRHFAFTDVMQGFLEVFQPPRVHLTESLCVRFTVRADRTVRALHSSGMLLRVVKVLRCTRDAVAVIFRGGTADYFEVSDVDRFRRKFRRLRLG